jgi:hypothetical protein
MTFTSINCYFCNDIAKMLSALSTYRPVIAAMLLALYAFVVTPVKHWHRHASTASGTDLTLYSKGNAIHAGKERCAICTHQYAACEEDLFFHWQSGSLFLGIITCFYHQETTLSFALIYSNKGPPPA